MDHSNKRPHLFELGASKRANVAPSVRRARRFELGPALMDAQASDESRPESASCLFGRPGDLHRSA